MCSIHTGNLCKIFNLSARMIDNCAVASSILSISTFMVALPTVVPTEISDSASLGSASKCQMNTLHLMCIHASLRICLGWLLGERLSDLAQALD